MNYTMITNHAHAHTNPPSPLKEPESKKIGFVAPIFASSEISKPLICYLKMVQLLYHNKIKMKWYKS